MLKKKIYYFVYNSNNNHLILEFDQVTSSISVVFRDSVNILGGETNLLKFTATELVTSIDIVKLDEDDDLLYWVYENSEPYKLNIRKAKLFTAGDYVFPTNQPGVKYLLETLEPEAVDSYFNWNFFDAILQQKEGYSAYVFEDLAAELLQKDAQLKAAFEAKKAAEPEFAANGRAQLDWVYKNSAYYEKAHLQYPVYRLLK
jgi:hypothetical protein